MPAIGEVYVRLHGQQVLAEYTIVSKCDYLEAEEVAAGDASFWVHVAQCLAIAALPVQPAAGVHVPQQAAKGKDICSGAESALQPHVLTTTQMLRTASDHVA